MSGKVKASRIETTVSMEKLLADLERYRESAVSLGAAGARVIPANLADCFDSQPNSQMSLPGARVAHRCLEVVI